MRTALFAALALAIAAPAAAQAPTKIAVGMANFDYTPSHIALHAGQSVTIHFVNNGSGGHDFTAEEFFAAATMDPANRAKVGDKGRVSLAKGESIDVTLTPRAGEYKVHCSHFMHSSLGMTGSISVT